MMLGPIFLIGGKSTTGLDQPAVVNLYPVLEKSTLHQLVIDHVVTAVIRD